MSDRLVLDDDTDDISAAIQARAEQARLDDDERRRQIEAERQRQWQEQVERDRERRKRTVAMAMALTPAHRVLQAASAVFCLPTTTITGPRRRPHEVRARQAVAYVIRKHGSPTRWSLPRIGKFLGGRDHSTILHSCRVVEDRIVRDQAYAAAVAQLEDAWRQFGVAA